MRSFPAISLFRALLMLAASMPVPAGATDDTDAPPAAVSAPEAAAPETPETRRAELDAVTRDIALTAERQAALKAEIDSLDRDRATLNQSLIDGGREVQKLEGEIDEAEGRLSAILDNEDALRASLAKRRDVLAEVLAALQRMGHNPPPALLVRPEDALASIHSAILLGAVVPELRVAADQVANDLKQLVAVREEKEKERDRLRADAAALAEGRARIALLIDERQKQRADSVAALATEQQRAGVLADQATSLRDLIARMEAENATAASAAAAAKASQTALAEGDNGKGPAKSLGDAGRLTPKVAFANAKGLLPFPANGTEIKAFGDDDGLGGKTQGISLATRESAEVSSPSDGWVVYAGPFRSYGQLLIINAGDGYHVLLAGMEKIEVQLGQFVLAGEPVGVMASQKLASVGAVNVGVTQPVLYIEFRKDGASIDPTPWWAASNVEKVGG